MNKILFLWAQRIVAISILAFSIAMPAFSQSIKIQALQEKLENTTSDSLKADIYIDLHNEVFKTDLESAQKYATQIIAFGQRAGSWKQVETGYQGLARCERKRRNYAAVFPYDLKALEFAKKTGSEGENYLCLIQLARDYMDADMMEKALPYLKEANISAQLTARPAYLAKAQQSFGYYYYKLQRHGQAVGYFRQAIASATIAKDQYITATSQMWMGYSLIQLRQTKEVPELIFSALNYFEGINSQSSKATCYELLGACYLGNGDSKRGVESFLEARRLYEASQNTVQQGLVCPDLARCYLLTNDFENAKKYISQADRIFSSSEYTDGQVQVKTAWGQYYSQTGSSAKAEKYFREADAMIRKHPQTDLSINNETYWAAHAYRNGNRKRGDSLTFSYTKRISGYKQPEIILGELKSIKQKNSGLDSIAFEDLKLLYSKDGEKKIKAKYGTRSLQSIIPFLDSLSLISPYSNASATQDSMSTAQFNTILIDKETHYRTRIKSDSLLLVSQNVASAKKTIQARNQLLLVSAAGLLVLILLIISLFFASRREKRDKIRILELRKDLEHRVINYLVVVNNIVDSALQSGDESPQTKILNTRIKAITKLHKRLTGSSENDKVDMQDYLFEIAQCLKAVFDVDDRVKITVSAPMSISGDIASPVGLIANEIITNSLKHAFDGKAEGLIHVKLTETGRETYELNIFDNGKGFDAQHVAKNTGMPLLFGLANQIRGTLSLLGSKGTEMKLIFKDTKTHEDAE